MRSLRLRLTWLSMTMVLMSMCTTNKALGQWTPSPFKPQNDITLMRNRIQWWMEECSSNPENKKCEAYEKTIIPPNPSEEEEIEDDTTTSAACDFKHCKQVFTSYGDPLTLDCAVASGEFNTKQLKLPLSFPGNYELCETFEQAHYCTIDTGFIGLPLGKTNFWPVGTVHIGKCIPKTCKAKDLKKKFMRELNEFTAMVALLDPNVLDKVFGVVIRDMIANSTVVRCVDETKASYDKDAGFYAWVYLAAFLFTLICVASMYEAFVMPGEDGTRTPETWSEELILCFSAIHNSNRLFAEVKGDFLSLNGIRVISMFWIILGHTAIEAGGIMTMSTNPNINPTAVDVEFRANRMIFLKGAEYAVDTFFFMSGFLACLGMIEMLQVKGLSFANYVYGIILRYIRLTPSYSFVLLFIIKVAPHTGTGPFWDQSMGPSSYAISQCSKYWWTNLLYINNFYPSEGHGTMGCMPWSWYLGNDMIFFLLIAPFSALFLFFQRRNTSGYQRILELYSPVCVLIVIQLITTYWTIEHYQLNSPLALGFDHVYVAAWCRVSPYAVGMMLAMYHTESKRLAQLSGHPESWRILNKDTMVTTLLFVLAFIVILAILLVVFDQYECKADPQTDCKVWFGFFKYGLFAAPNWAGKDKHYLVTLYYGSTYLLYSLALAFICYFFFAGYGSFVNRFLSSSIWTPFARLTYNAYLVHMLIMSMFFSRAPAFTYFSPPQYMMQCISFILVAYSVSFGIFLLVEKPVMNLTALTTTKSHLKGKLTAPSRNANYIQIERHQSELSLMKTPKELDQHLADVTDIDSETLVLLGSPKTIASSSSRVLASDSNASA